MPKIKEITERLEKNPTEYTDIRFLMAKRTVAFFLMLYYLVFLFTIGGFSLGPLSISGLAVIAYHLYSVLAIVIAWFFYEVGVYVDHIYFATRKWPVWIFLAFGIFWLSFVLFTHLSTSLY